MRRPAIRTKGSDGAFHQNYREANLASIAPFVGGILGDKTLHAITTIRASGIGKAPRDLKQLTIVPGSMAM
jgi:hypothetical protein